MITVNEEEKEEEEEEEEEIMSGTTRIYLLNPPVTIIYGGLFILAAIATTLINLVALFILVKSKANRSNAIFFSLTFFDLCVGTVLLPFMTYQVMATDLVDDFWVDIFRTYLSSVFIGTLSLNLILIGVDRYVLLTKFPIYDKVMSKNNIVFMLASCFVVTTLAPMLRFTGNNAAYMFSLVLIFYAPLISISILYPLLTRTVYKKQKQLLEEEQRKTSAISLAVITRNEEFSGSNELLEPTTRQCIATKLSNALRFNNLIKRDSWQSIQSENSGVDVSTGQIISQFNKKQQLAKARIIKIVQNSGLLFACYFMCAMPFNVWLILNTVNIYCSGDDDNSKRILDEYSLQNLYIFATFIGTLNSFLNPLIYMFKIPIFRSTFKKYYRKVTLIS